MNIEELYLNDSFNNLLIKIANRRKIEYFDDFKQDVFFEILDCNYSNMRDYKRAADRVSYRYCKEYEAKFSKSGDKLFYSYEDGRDSYKNDIDGKRESILWEDNHVVV